MGGAFTAATFGATQRSLFSATLAGTLAVSSEAVSVTGVADAASPTGGACCKAAAP